MKTKLTALSAILISALTVLSTFAASNPRPLVMAHRGGLVEADENTMKAFNLAIDRGVDIIECDPKLTKDGHWIIMHDKTVYRTTNGTGKVSKLTFDQIRNLRTTRGEPIPTLEEVLELGKKRGVIVFLDMHIPPPDIKAFFEIVDNHGMTERVIVNTWIKPFQIELNRLRPDIVTCFPYPKPTPRLKTVKKLGVDIVGTLAMFATGRMIRKCHRMGMKVVTMPINNEWWIRKFAEKGLDIIQTDDPRLSQNVFGLSGNASSLRLYPKRLYPMGNLAAR